MSVFRQVKFEQKQILYVLDKKQNHGKKKIF